MRKLTILAVICMVQPALAAPIPDPDWPCIQRRQPQLSVAQVWAGPIPDEKTTSLAQTPEVQGVAKVISLRRTSLEDADKIIAEFSQTADEQKLVALFQASFEHIQKTRNQVMAGITRYAHKQAALEQSIKEKRDEFAALSGAEPRDFDAIDRVEEDLDWSTRIFQDRQQALTYVCETPVILEQRIFSIGRSIASQLKGR